MMTPTAAARWTVAILAAASLAACASKPKPGGPGDGPGGPGGPPPPGSAGDVFGPQTEPTGPATPGSVRDFAVNAGDRVYFDYDSSDIRGEGQRILGAQAAWLQRYPNVKVRIEGNADERGTREYNFALGARRANAVAEFLVSRGVSASRISTVSYGKERPIDGGTGEEAWARNRNGHTAITEGAR